MREHHLLALHFGGTDADDVEFALYPSVTPVTALATSVRASPRNFARADLRRTLGMQRSVGQLKTESTCCILPFGP
jgi:hypothetical protein